MNFSQFFPSLFFRRLPAIFASVAFRSAGLAFVILPVFSLLAFLAASCSSTNSTNASRFPKKTSLQKTALPSRAERKRAGKLTNRVRFIVGTEPITDLDIRQMKRRIRLSRKRGRGSLEKRAVDALIERAIVAMEAEKQTIIISDQRIENEVRRRMQRLGISDEAKFRRIIETETGMPFGVWKDEMRYDLTKSQLVRIALSVPPATEQEIEGFYRKNRRKVGVEVRYREMAFRGASEAETSRIAAEAYRKLRAAPSRFGEIARSHPNNVASSKAYGGLRPFTELSGIAQTNRILAAILFNTGVGAVSRVFRDSRGRYMIIKVEGRRPVPISKVRDLIRQRLYYEKQGKVFENWIQKRREEIAIVAVK